MNELRIAAIGNVDSAKSTTISVIANNSLDDGRGKARALILKHFHEKDRKNFFYPQHFVKTDKSIIYC